MFLLQKMRILLLCALIGVVIAENDWQPILPEESLSYSSYKSQERSLRPRYFSKSTCHIKKYQKCHNLKKSDNKITS